MSGLCRSLFPQLIRKVGGCLTRILLRVAASSAGSLKPVEICGMMYVDPIAALNAVTSHHFGVILIYRA
jgi:hypothetical protein